MDVRSSRRKAIKEGQCASARPTGGNPETHRPECRLGRPRRRQWRRRVRASPRRGTTDRVAAGNDRVATPARDRPRGKPPSPESASAGSPDGAGALHTSGGSQSSNPARVSRPHPGGNAVPRTLEMVIVCSLRGGRARQRRAEAAGIRSDRASLRPTRWEGTRARPRAADMVGALPDFLRRLDEAKLFVPFRSADGHCR